MPKPKVKPVTGPFIVRSINIEETVHGSMINALKTAVDIAYLETRYPHKLGQVGICEINENGNRLVISISTPRQRKE
jgi:hypothetical protein